MSIQFWGGNDDMRWEEITEGQAINHVDQGWEEALRWYMDLDQEERDFLADTVRKEPADLLLCEELEDVLHVLQSLAIFAMNELAIRHMNFEGEIDGNGGTE